MKNIFKIAMGTALLSATVTMAAPKYPFPQNMKSPNGYTVPFATTDVIKDHFKTWKQAWYQDKGNEAWILAPEGTCSTVSEAIAYGMLIMVYMSDNQNDYKSEFDKLYATWKNNGGNGGGMHWRIGCDGGTGSATDSDIDAAVALVMAAKQWGNDSYLNDAKSLINWIETNDFNGTQLKPGNQWNDAFNPSYAGLANFKLFEKVTGKSSWSTHRSDVAKDLLACQNSSTGLVPDWCSWGSHQPAKTSASVAQTGDAGFFDDAARTPWRTAWAYYWYGDSDALTFNTKISKWLIPTTKTASGVNSGYYVDGKPETSEKRRFVSSTFSGGLGLATSSLSTDDAKNYMETVYKALASMKSCATASGCGEGVSGEKYYPSTLNLLYLLLMTGNMPNLYDLSGFTAFTPDPSLMRSSDSGVDGVQQARGDSTVGVSGFWNWGAYHDKYAETGTKMTPDSGASPVYLRSGAYYADAVMEIGPEPEWTAEAAAAGTLKYPSAGIAMSFNKDESGVDLKALGVAKLRLTVKSEGPIRFAILSTAVVEAGAEPGMFIPSSSDYQTIEYSLKPYEYGFLGRATNGSSAPNDSLITILDWVDVGKAPLGEEILTSAKGLKFEVKDAKGGYGAVSVKAIEFLDASGNVIDPAKITGTVVPSVVPSDPNNGTDPNTPVDPNTGDAIKAVSVDGKAFVTVANQQIQIVAAQGTDFAVFSMQGKVVANGKLSLGNATVSVPSKGVYMVRVGNKISKVNVK